MEVNVRPCIYVCSYLHKYLHAHTYTNASGCMCVWKICLVGYIAFHIEILVKSARKDSWNKQGSIIMGNGGEECEQKAQNC